MSWIFIVVVYVQVAALQGCIFGPGSDCVFPCRCSDALGNPYLLTSGGSCDPVTGWCQTGQCLSSLTTSQFDRWGWSSDGCQTGNQAFLKTAFVTDTGVEAVNSVDGWVGSEEHDCTSVDTGNPEVAASVTVDLGMLYTITGVHVYNTHDSEEFRYLENYSVSTGYAAPSTKDICNTYDRQVPKGESPQLGCYPPIPVRYVTIGKLDTASYKHRIVICEIIVIGSPYYDVDCRRCNSTEQCHPDMWCEQCVEGWTGHDCNTVAVSSTAPTSYPLTPQPTNDSRQLTIIAASVSGIALILVVLLVVAICYIVRLRRKGKGKEPDRADSGSDYDQYLEPVQGAQGVPHGRNHGRVERVNDIHNPVYHNNAMDEAAARTRGATQGGDSDLYEEMAAVSEDTIHENTGSSVNPAALQQSSYEALKKQAGYSNLPPPPAVYQELGH